MGNVTKPNSFEVFDLLCIFTLWDKAQEGPIHTNIYVTVSKHSLQKVNLVFHYVPVLLVKNRVDSIRTRGFYGFKRLQ